MGEGKKTVHDFEFIGRIIDIMKILHKETDECTVITQSDILNILEEHGHTCSARTLTDYLKMIMRELNPEDVNGCVHINATIDDYKIIPKGLEDKLRARDIGLKGEDSKKLQLRNLRYNHIFSFEELNQVVEAVLFLKNIGDDTKENLIRKLQTLSSTNFPKYCPYISENTGKVSKKFVGVFEDSRVDEMMVRENIKLIRKAIEDSKGVGCKIAFHFNGYNENKQLIPRRNEDGSLIKYVVNPYYIILYNSKHYLICNSEPYTNVSIYRIDLMSDITDKTLISSIDGKTLISRKRKAKREIDGLPQQWNSKEASDFQAEHLYMFYGKAERITLKLDKERYTLLHDYFGDRYEFRKHIDEKWDEVVVSCVPNAMTIWALQCSDYVEVLRPESIRLQIYEKCKQLTKKYE